MSESVKIYLVVECSSHETKGVLSSHAKAMEWMDEAGYYWPLYTVQTWIVDTPAASYEEWI